MAIELICKQCGKSLHARDELAGQRVKCPKCGDVIEFPNYPAPEPRRTVSKTLNTITRPTTSAIRSTNS